MKRPLRIPKFENQRLRARLIIVLLATGLLPVMIMLVTVITVIQRGIIDNEYEKRSNLIAELSREAGLVMQRAADVLSSLPSNEKIVDPQILPEVRLGEMKRLGQAHPIFTEISLYDGNGDLIESTARYPKSREQTSWFKEAFNGYTTFSRPLRVPGSEELRYFVYLPVKPEPGREVHVIKATLPFTQVWGAVAETDFKYGNLVLLDQFGNTLYSRDSSTPLNTKFDMQVSPEMWFKKLQGGYTDKNGKSCRYVSHPVSPDLTMKSEPVALIWLESSDSFFRLVRHSYLYLIWALFVAIIFAYLAATFLSRMLASPIVEACEVASQAAAGDLSVELTSSGTFEMNQLSQSLNHMLERIRGSQEVLELRADELGAANLQLERAARMKDEFLAAMSHELRTPLNAVLGLTHALQEGVYGELNEEQAETLEIIRCSGDHLLGLINDILDVAKIESGEIKLKLAPVDLSKLCESAINLVYGCANQNQINLRMNLEPDIGLVNADERKLKQALVNLLGNAVKFTRVGGHVQLDVIGDRAGNAIRFFVRDDGIGIAPEDMDKLFKPFVQVDNRLARAAEGSGLGLALVQRLVELHGGLVTVQSELGKGSCFVISLPWNVGVLAGPVKPPVPLIETTFEVWDPVKPEVSDERCVAPQTFTHARRILLVDDNAVNLRMLGAYLAKKGHEVAVAQSGYEGINLAQQSHPELIFMDVQMPGMDGLEATRRLRAEVGFGQTPIIAVTALSMPGDRERFLAAGMNEHLSKPVDFTRLSEVIEIFAS